MGLGECNTLCTNTAAKAYAPWCMLWFLFWCVSYARLFQLPHLRIIKNLRYHGILLGKKAAQCAHLSRRSLVAGRNAALAITS